MTVLSTQLKQIRLSGVVKESIVDGPGIRYVIFTQGCPHHCKGCHNPETWNEKSGKLKEIAEIYQEIKANPLVTGVTLSGGEPMIKAKELYSLIKKLKEENYHIMIYTGYLFEYLIENGNEENYFLELLKLTDILVDGKFIIDQKDLLLKFRGSKNQRIIDVQKSLEESKVTTVEL